MKIINNSKTGKIITWIVAILFIGVIIVTSIESNNDAAKLKDHGVIANAHITDITTTVRGDFAINYRFTVNGKSFKNQHSYGELLSRYQSDFVNKSFPVIYLSQNPNINFLLVTPQSFKMYDKDFPDSLKWVKQYMR